MTVPSNITKHIYDGDGVTTHWPFTFTVVDDEDVKVYVTDADGLLTEITSDFTVDLDGEEVIYPVTGDPLPSDGTKITILRKSPVTQLTDYKNQGAFNAETLETALDKLTMIAQQHDEELSRSIKLSVDLVGDDSLDALAEAVRLAQDSAQEALGAKETIETLINFVPATELPDGNPDGLMLCHVVSGGRKGLFFWDGFGWKAFMTMG